MSTATSEATTPVKPRDPILNPNVPKTVTFALPQDLYETLQEHTPEEGVVVMQESSRQSRKIVRVCAHQMVAGDDSRETALAFGMAELSALASDAVAETLRANAALGNPTQQPASENCRDQNCPCGGQERRPGDAPAQQPSGGSKFKTVAELEEWVENVACAIRGTTTPAKYPPAPRRVTVAIPEGMLAAFDTLPPAERVDVVVTLLEHAKIYRDQAGLDLDKDRSAIEASGRFGVTTVAVSALTSILAAFKGEKA
jgi:hypothetical protein